MESIETLRRAHITANRDSAIHRQDSAVQAAQVKAQPFGSDIFGLPCDPNGWLPLQDLNPASSSYGLFYQIEGYSREGKDPPRPNP